MNATSQNEADRWVPGWFLHDLQLKFLISLAVGSYHQVLEAKSIENIL